MAVRQLSNELQSKAETELGEVPSRVEKDIEHILKWISQQPHLKARTEPQHILTFLRGCKFSLQKTKEKLEMYYTVRSLAPEIFQNRDPMLPEIQEILNYGLFLPLRKVDPEDGPRVIIVRCDTADPTKISCNNIVKVMVMIIDILMNEDDNFVVAGQHALNDFKDMNLNHVLHTEITLVKKLAICLQKAYPTRPKGFYCINATSLFTTCYNLAIPFLSEKLRKRVIVCHSSNILEQFSPKILPVEYGGTSGTSIADLKDYWKKKVESYGDWFLDDAKYGLDERKRVHNKKTCGEVFGIDGSFRKLEID